VRYRVKLQSRAVKGLAALPANIRRDIGSRIDALAEEPLPPRAEPLRGDLEGFHKLRSGDYRVVYHVDQQAQLVTILRVGHRHNVYK
jgi:mRNA interferase RelE/StbE